MKPFKEMTQAEANAVFRDYLEASPSAIAWLKAQFEQTGGGKASELDFSKASLVKLWRWFLPHIRIRPYTEAEMQALRQECQKSVGQMVQERSYYRESEKQSIRQSLPNALLKEAERGRLTEETMNLVYSIAYYFASVFLHELPGVSWEVCHQKTVDYNQPVLFGFHPAPLNPLRIVYNVAGQALENPSAERLLEVFEIWANKFDSKSVCRRKK